MGLSIVDMPADEGIRHTAATWSLEHWRGDFPHDTIEWYLDRYREADATPGVPVAMVAFMDGEPVGSGLLIDDDELPDASEPGPWLAAVYVVESARGQGVGTALVNALTRRGHEHGHATVYLYTEHARDWYASMGWSIRRTARLADHDVVVMSHTVAN